MLWDLDKFLSQFYNYSGSKRNEMWGKSLLRPAVGLRQIWTIFFNYSGCKRNEMWGRNYVRPAVGLSQIFEINFINTAGLRGD